MPNGNTSLTSLRFVTAASLFDGHDVSINIIRRILQSKGVEVIHLGHNRSAEEVVNAAIEEDAHAVALSSYQGGHNEYFLYVRRLLDQKGAKNIRIFGGGGGVITPDEIISLEKKGITKIYSPEDGASLGLVGIIDDMIDKASFSTIEDGNFPENSNDSYHIARVITYIEDKGRYPFDLEEKKTPVLGVTGTGGAGKSSLIDELLLRFRLYYPQKKIALISIDPTKKKTRGALLGDRIRLNNADGRNIFVRSLATRHSQTELSPHSEKVASYMKSLHFDLLMVETSGIGQAGDAVTSVADKCLYVMTPEYGAATQLEKLEMLEQADFIAINKFEKPRSEDALRDVRTQYRRNKGLFVGHPHSPNDESLPVFGTMASKFSDKGVNDLFFEIATSFCFETETLVLERERASRETDKIIPTGRALYLREIVDTVRNYNRETKEETKQLERYETLEKALEFLPQNLPLQKAFDDNKNALKKQTLTAIHKLDSTIEMLKRGEYVYKVRGKDIVVETQYTSLSHNKISKVSYPRFSSQSSKYQFTRNENLPGFFPFSQGIFPFKRKDEEPKRMFAGEGGPRKTNKRFHYLADNEKAKRLSTAFDSITLYGEDPDYRPDIFGKIGEAGVSIATLDDMEILYSGFDLIDPKTSVSMTINGPAPMILAMFFSVGLKQNLKACDYWDETKRIDILRKLRGTIQADILKEDQAQNTCIFSLEFALKMMGDMQEYLCKHKIKNYYSVSISGYHIAEAGANPITQAALTLSNGFTYVEYYLSRGMPIDEFATNLSFFFSNGLDPEYAVIGRVARKIWAITLRDKYGAAEKAQKFKYHIQTSGRSLHAQEIDFNDIRTTLQAFLALSDNCNSLHTNAYDEAVTTPTQESVRRAMAIQMIINREFGLNKTDNPLQGSFLLNELADIVEESILSEFERISDKGGVLGAMESMYQRSKIQEESLHYETLKDSGELEIIGVNTYRNESSEQGTTTELSRSSVEEKREQIERLRAFKKKHEKESDKALERLRTSVLNGDNIFESLLYCVNFCSLGQMTNLLYKIGGKYRRNM